jgi:hypothetical protein
MLSGVACYCMPSRGQCCCGLPFSPFAQAVDDCTTKVKGDVEWRRLLLHAKQGTVLLRLATLPLCASRLHSVDGCTTKGKGVIEWRRLLLHATRGQCCCCLAPFSAQAVDGCTTKGKGVIEWRRLLRHATRGHCCCCLAPFPFAQAGRTTKGGGGALAYAVTGCQAGPLYVASTPLLSHALNMTTCI